MARRYLTLELWGRMTRYHYALSHLLHHHGSELSRKDQIRMYHECKRVERWIEAAEKNIYLLFVLPDDRSDWGWESGY